MFRGRHSTLIKQKAKELGFDYCGISKAEFLEEEAPKLETWLSRGMQGTMSYMERNFDKRLDPRKLFEGAKSVVSVLLNYYPGETIQNPESYRISKYAYGKDYHLVLKDKLKTLLQCIRETVGDVQGRAFTDSAPIMDKVWAQKSGLGWIGKHANLLNRGIGSFFFIGELILDLDLEPDGPLKDYCGSCTRCMDACPTEAIAAPYVVDGSKCISYFTIELKEEIPSEMQGKFGDWIFGCDICQEVCPWNRFAQPHRTPEFEPFESVQKWKKKEWEEITEEVFNKVFKDSPLKRAKLGGLKRNIRFVQEPS